MLTTDWHEPIGLLAFVIDADDCPARHARVILDEIESVGEYWELLAQVITEASARIHAVLQSCRT